MPLVIRIKPYCISENATQMKVIGAAASHNRLQINEKISSEKLVIFPFGNVDVFHHMVS